MAELPLSVRAARDTVNDETVLLSRWAAQDGERVQRGQLVAEIETSKSVLEVAAPEAGYVRQTRKAGEKVPVGAVLFVLTATAGEPLPKEEASAAAGSASSRFSQKALALMQRHGLSPSDFGGEGLVREADVLALAARKDAGQPAVAGGARSRLEPLPERKLAEVRYLSSGQNAGLASSVSVLCATKGLRALAASRAEWGGSLLPVVIFECARLLPRHPALNAAFEEGSARYYQDVNVGFALDAGQGLVVPVVGAADQKPLDAVVAEVQDLMLQYVDGSLDVKKLAPGTFTITDLSGEGVFGVQPLINWRQSAILGVGAEFSMPGWPGSLLQLSLTFDHRLTEGRAAAAFLRELQGRLLSYEAGR